MHLSTDEREKQALRDAVLRRRLGAFIGKSFTTVDPGAEYLPNWHIDVIADHLKRVSDGEIKRLIINMPPRSLKSLCVSVAWPAWLLGINPAIRVMAASYSLGLAVRHSLDCRQIMQSPWYRHIFPTTRLTKDQNEKHRFTTTKRGFRFATSVGGTATGEGGDILIVDDPHTAMQAESDVQREKALLWFDQTFMSRLNHKKKGAVVVVMQRLHPDDLTGHLLAKPGQNWTQLELPAIAKRRELFFVPHLGEVVREIGDVLHPGHEGMSELDILKEALGSHAFSAQYQQEPMPEEGAMLKYGWIKRFDAMPAEGIIVQSWDTAIKAGSGNDFSTCSTWKMVERDAAQEAGFYLLDMLAERMEYPELRRAVLTQAERWQPEAILVEDKASGQSLLQDLRREMRLPLIAIRPFQNKVQRFAAVTPLFEAGKVFFPYYMGWLGDLEAELLAFPHVPHDDQTDSVSQFLHWARERTGGMRPRIRTA